MKAQLVAVALVASTLTLAPTANAACAQFGFPGFTQVNQSNGYRIEFNATEASFSDVGVTAFNNQQAVVNQGTVAGNVDGHGVIFNVRWDNGTGGEYTGSINDSGKARGQTSGGGGSANWNARQKFICLDAPQ